MQLQSPREIFTNTLGRKFYSEMAASANRGLTKWTFQTARIILESTKQFRQSLMNMGNCNCFMMDRDWIPCVPCHHCVIMDDVMLLDWLIQWLQMLVNCLRHRMYFHQYEMICNETNQ